MTMFSIKIKIKGRTVIMSAANPIVAMLISSASYRRPPTASFLKNATSSSSLSVPASPPTGRQWQQDGIHCRYTATCFFLKNVTRASSLSVPASPPTGKQWQQDGIHCGYTATCFLLRKQPAPPCCLYQQPHPQARNGSKTSFTARLRSFLLKLIQANVQLLREPIYAHCPGSRPYVAAPAIQCSYVAAPAIQCSKKDSRDPRKTQVTQKGLKLSGVLNKELKHSRSLTLRTILAPFFWFQAFL